MQEGENIELQKQTVKAEKCRECSKLMVNLDVDQLAPGDLVTLKRLNVLISNPETDKAVCLNCEYQTFGKKLNDWFASDGKDDDNDDSSFFTPSTHSSPSTFGGGSSFGGFGGGFGGGGFGGAGASRGF